MQKYTPTAYEEFLGYIDPSNNLTYIEAALHNTEYEMFFNKALKDLKKEKEEKNNLQKNLLNDKDKGGKCTAYSYAGKDNDLKESNSDKKEIISGQTNDEDEDRWLYAKYDTVLKLQNLPKEQGGEVLIYTHPGSMAYTGINGAGLSLLWTALYVEFDNYKDDIINGVPTLAIIRETLTKTNLKDAINFLNTVPHTVSNNYLITKSNEGSVNLECMPVKGCLATYIPIGKGRDIVHTNHIVYDEEVKSIDKGFEYSTTSLPRYNFMIKSLNENARENMSVDVLKKLFSGDCCDKGVLRDCTLATFIFENEKRKMHIRFMGEDLDNFHVYSIEGLRYLDGNDELELKK